MYSQCHNRYVSQPIKRYDRPTLQEDHQFIGSKVLNKSRSDCGEWVDWWNVVEVSKGLFARDVIPVFFQGRKIPSILEYSNWRAKHKKFPQLLPKPFEVFFKKANPLPPSPSKKT